MKQSKPKELDADKKKRRKKNKKKKRVKLIGQMLIDPGKIKRVEVNKENIEYYNNIYESMRSEASKNRKIQR